MELESKPFQNNELEDGELSDNSDGYTPLQRPDILKPSVTEVSNSYKMDANQIEEDSVSDFGKSSDSSTDSDDDRVCMNTGSNKKKEKRTVLVRVKSTQQKKEKPKFKKYDIWTAGLQEDSLMENMRGIGVAKNSKKSDRNVENYDFTLKYSLNGENTLKRRLSNSGDDMSEDNKYYHQSKRIKSSGLKERRSVKDRLGRRKDSSSSCDSQNSPRHILDLNITPETKNDDIGRQIANKLYEEKNELLVRVVDILGRDIPIALFKETQRIEKDGGMMIMNGKRRRTPGGVFLFLLKHHETITPEEKKEIFIEDRKNSIKELKTIQSIKRDKKVEELKKRLNQKEKELTPLITRSEVATTSHLKPESTTLSNPPPSPVASQEYSPEYKSHAINHVTDEKARISNDLEDESLSGYDDIFDAGGGDVMDMF